MLRVASFQLLIGSSIRWPIHMLTKEPEPMKTMGLMLLMHMVIVIGVIMGSSRESMTTSFPFYRSTRLPERLSTNLFSLWARSPREPNKMWPNRFPIPGMDSLGEYSF